MKGKRIVLFYILKINHSFSFKVIVVDHLAMCARSGKSYLNYFPKGPIYVAHVRVLIKLMRLFLVCAKHALEYSRANPSRVARVPAHKHSVETGGLGARSVGAGIRRPGGETRRSRGRSCIVTWPHPVKASCSTPDGPRPPRSPVPRASPARTSRRLAR